MVESLTTIQEPKRDNEKLIRWILGVASIVAIIALLVIKNTVPTFSWSSFFTWVAITVVAAAGIIIGFHYAYKRKSTQEDDTLRQSKTLPPAVTMEQAWEIAEKQIENPRWADYIRGGVLHEETRLVGRGTKHQVAIFQARGKHEHCVYTIIVNMHYPLQRTTVLIDATEFKITQSAEALADNPQEEPDIRTITTRNPILGTEQTITEKMKNDGAKPADAKKEDDL